MKQRSLFRTIMDEIPGLIGSVALFTILANDHPWMAVVLGIWFAGSLISVIVFRIFLAILPHDFVERAMPEEMGY